MCACVFEERNEWNMSSMCHIVLSCDTMRKSPSNMRIVMAMIDSHGVDGWVIHVSPVKNGAVLVKYLAMENTYLKLFCCSCSQCIYNYLELSYLFPLCIDCLSWWRCKLQENRLLFLFLVTVFSLPTIVTDTLQLFKHICWRKNE